MNIPALIDVDIQPEWNGKLAIVDGKEGQLIIEPDEETLAFYRRQQQEEQEARALLSELKGQEDITLNSKGLSSMLILPGLEMLQMCLQMMQQVLGCSAVNSYIWRQRIIRMKKLSFGI